MISPIFIFSILFSTFAQSISVCGPQLGTIPTLQNGRVKPLMVHAREMLKDLTGKSSFYGLDATTAYCLLSSKNFGAELPGPMLAPIEHEELKTIVGLKSDQHTIDYEQLGSLTSTLQTKSREIVIENSLKKAINKLLFQIRLYQSLTQGEDWKIAQESEQLNWQSFQSLLTQSNLTLRQKKQVEDLLLNSTKIYERFEGDRYRIEIIFTKLNLPWVALFLNLLALMAFSIDRTKKWAHFYAIPTVITQVTYITLRVMISGRAPVTNMYETVIFSGLGALILALVIGHLKKEKSFVFIGLIYNTCCLLMINFAHGMLDPKIGPLVPVLRDNFWLSTHVTTIIVSYGALALSWVLANFLLIKKKFFNLNFSDEKYYADVVYTSLKVGTTLLAAGIILGGVWADYSWGRFWGWDPKETWSLIVLCLYIAILHGKYTSWIPVNRFISLVALAFLSVMMAWFGVNYILATGLHSYGFSEGGAIFLATFFVIQISIVAITWERPGKQRSL